MIDDFDAFFCFSSEKFLNVFCFNVGLREWNGFGGGMTMRAGERRWTQFRLKAYIESALNNFERWRILMAAWKMEIKLNFSARGLGFQF